MTLAGPPAKRPPQSWLDCPLPSSRVSIVPLLALLAAACAPAPVASGADKGKAAASQASALAASRAAGKARIVDRRRAGTPAPAAAFTGRDGQPRTLAAFRGRPVLVNLWATWCAPCLAEMPDLDALAAARPGLAVVAISQDLGGWPAIDGFFTPGRFKALTPWLDARGGFPRALGATGLPVSILYDTAGREVWRVAGPLEWTTPEVMALLPQ